MLESKQGVPCFVLCWISSDSQHAHVKGKPRFPITIPIVKTRRLRRDDVVTLPGTGQFLTSDRGRI